MSSDSTLKSLLKLTFYVYQQREKNEGSPQSFVEWVTDEFNCPEGMDYWEGLGGDDICTRCTKTRRLHTGTRDEYHSFKEKI